MLLPSPQNAGVEVLPCKTGRTLFPLHSGGGGAAAGPWGLHASKPREEKDDYREKLGDCHTVEVVHLNPPGCSGKVPSTSVPHHKKWKTTAIHKGRSTENSDLRNEGLGYRICKEPYSGCSKGYVE
jgi:hypothetical protein